MEESVSFRRCGWENWLKAAWIISLLLLIAIFNSGCKLETTHANAQAIDITSTRREPVREDSFTWGTKKLTSDNRLAGKPFEKKLKFYRPKLNFVDSRATTIVTSNGTSCMYQSRVRRGHLTYSCQNSSDLYLSDSATNKRFIDYVHPEELSLYKSVFGNFRGVASRLKFQAGFTCEPYIYEEWAPRNTQAYFCLDGSTRFLKSGIRHRVGGLWHIDQYLIEEIQLVPLLWPSEDSVTKIAGSGRSKSLVEDELQLLGFHLHWSEEFIDQNQSYISRIYSYQADYYAYANSTLVVYEKRGGDWTVLSSIETGFGKGLGYEYEMDDVLIEGWHDVNQDGRKELAIKYVTGGNFFGSPLLILQINQDGLINLAQRQASAVDDYSLVFWYLEDIDGGAPLELIAYDIGYQTIGGCHACGFSTEVIFQWDGEQYVDKSADFPDFYIPKIRSARSFDSSHANPHALIEQLVMAERIGEGDEGWKYLAEHWDHERFDEWYGHYFDALAQEYD